MVCIFFIITLLALFLFFRNNRIWELTLIARAFLFGIWFSLPVYIFLLKPFNFLEPSHHAEFSALVSFFLPPFALFVAFMVGAGPALMICSVFLIYKSIQFDKMYRLFAILIAILLGIMILLCAWFFLISASSISYIK